MENSTEILSDHPCCVVVMNERFLSGNLNKAKKIIDVHKRATEKIMANPEGMVQYLPPHIVPDSEIEKESLSHIKWVSNLNNTYKENVDNFLNIERDLGIINETLPHDKLYAKI